MDDATLTASVRVKAERAKRCDLMRLEGPVQHGLDGRITLAGAGEDGENAERLCGEGAASTADAHCQRIVGGGGSADGERQDQDAFRLEAVNPCGMGEGDSGVDQRSVRGAGLNACAVTMEHFDVG